MFKCDICRIKRLVRIKKKDVVIDKFFEYYGKECEWNEVLFYINRFYVDIR